MELNEEQKKALKEILDNKIQSNKQKEENKAVNDGKAVEWYSVLANANVNTRFEKDRQLLTLASLAIGILVSFIKDVTNYYLFGFWLFSSGCFLTTIILSLNIFQKNQYVLEDLIKGKNTDRLDTTLKTMDAFMYWSFILGVLSLLLLSLLQFDFKTFS